MPLDQELKTFKKIKGGLLKHYEGKYALIKEDSFIGAFDTAEAAFNSGIEKFGVSPFLIKQILKEEPVEHIPALTHHLIHANP